MKKWKAFKSTRGQEIPLLDNFSYDGAKLTIQVEFDDHIKIVTCNDVLSFKMIEEGNAFYTLAEQDFDGNIWIFETDSSALIDWFNQESLSIYSDQLISYIIVTRDQFFEVITRLKINISKNFV